MIVIAGVIEAARPGGLSQNEVVTGVLGLFVILTALVALLGVALGIAAVLQKQRKRLFSVLGLVVSSAVVVGIGLLITLGALVST
jgi:hypothetical protein